ncbi:SAGA-associated factor 11 [Entomortierella parvispora]|uniref:SAGA-associated factor 11 n=1 Tax=Entomortierella parvispora TaxID=205924 RepID=A0A9P3H1G3_9FUNG|nr:SAGA-associated factor 11 [Entomortierella parvispora]
MSSPLSRTSSSMSSTDMEALFAKIHKDQASQLELLRHTKRAMDKSIAARDASDVGAPSLASLSFEILGELMDDLILDVITEAHRDAKKMRSVCPICKNRCRNYIVRAGLDIFGQNPQTTNSQTYDCVHCQRSFPAQRYAPHLEKCLGLSGRTSSRNASRRMGAGERAGSGSPFTPVSYSDDREASDSDKDLMEKKRKKNAASSGAPSNGNGNGGSNGSSEYSTPNSTKSSSSNPSKVKKPKSDALDFGSKNQKSSLLAKASKGSSSIKLKGLGLHTPPTGSTPRAPTPVGEISLGFLDDNLLLANGRSLQNGSSGVSSGSAPLKLSSSNPKRAAAAAAAAASAAGGTSSSKRPPGSGSSKNGQVLSFYDSLKAIGSRDGSSSEAQTSDDDDDDDDDDRRGRRGSVSGAGSSSSTQSQPVHSVAHRLKKSSAFSGHGSDTDFIDIDGDGDAAFYRQ